MSYEIGSTVGRWTAFIEPAVSRRMRLRLIQRSHAGAGMAYVGPGGKVEPIKDYEVAFRLTELKEGDWSESPAIESPYGDNQVFDLLQAIVNEAAKVGIYPAGAADMTREISTLKQHLEDMRRLVFKAPGYEKLK